MKTEVFHPLQRVVEDVYSAGHVPRLHVNALHPGVELPDHVRERWGHQLVIDLDPHYPLNLVYDDRALMADLAFAGATFRCVFVWSCIYAVVDRTTSRGVVVEAHLPAALREAAAQERAPMERDRESSEEPDGALSKTGAKKTATSKKAKAVKLAQPSESEPLKAPRKRKAPKALAAADGPGGDSPSKDEPARARSSASVSAGPRLVAESEAKPVSSPSRPSIVPSKPDLRLVRERERVLHDSEVSEDRNLSSSHQETSPTSEVSTPSLDDAAEEIQSRQIEETASRKRASFRVIRNEETDFDS